MQECRNNYCKSTFLNVHLKLQSCLINVHTSQRRSSEAFWRRLWNLTLGSTKCYSLHVSCQQQIPHILMGCNPMYSAQMAQRMLKQPRMGLIILIICHVESDGDYTPNLIMRKEKKCKFNKILLVGIKWESANFQSSQNSRSTKHLWKTNACKLLYQASKAKDNMKQDKAKGMQLFLSENRWINWVENY